MTETSRFVIGQARYRGQTYYVAAARSRGYYRPVTSSDSLKILLYSRDGDSTWAEVRAVSSVQWYEQPRPIKDANAAAVVAKAAQARREGRRP